MVNCRYENLKSFSVKPVLERFSLRYHFSSKSVWCRELTEHAQHYKLEGHQHFMSVGHYEGLAPGSNRPESGAE
jgi:hypothetical protein